MHTNITFSLKSIIIFLKKYEVSKISPNECNTSKLCKYFCKRQIKLKFLIKHSCSSQLPLANSRLEGTREDNKSEGSEIRDIKYTYVHMYVWCINNSNCCQNVEITIYMSTITKALKTFQNKRTPSPTDTSFALSMCEYSHLNIISSFLQHASISTEVDYSNLT